MKKGYIFGSSNSAKSSRKEGREGLGSSEKE